MENRKIIHNAALLVTITIHEQRSLYTSTTFN